MEYFVSADAVRSGDGSNRHPFKTIREAAGRAKGGDTVIVMPGIYREWVRPLHGGTQEQPVVYRSETKGGAVISGAEPVTEWKQVEKGIYAAFIRGASFGGPSPYGSGEGTLFLNDVPQRMVADRRSLVPPENGMVTWCAEAEKLQLDTKIYVFFGDMDPAAETVEIAARRHAFYADRPGIHHIHISGFVFNKCAVPGSNLAGEARGMTGAEDAYGWVMEDCEIAHTRGAGIAFGAARNSPRAWAAQFVKEAHVLRLESLLQKTGVPRGGHTIRRCHIHDCETAGILAASGAFSFEITDNHIHQIGRGKRNTPDGGCGIDLAAAQDTRILRNRIDHCDTGVKLSHGAQNILIKQNLLHDNDCIPENDRRAMSLAGADLRFETLCGPVLADHNLLMSERAAYLYASGVAFTHNLIRGAFSTEGAAAETYAPYFVPHEPVLAGVAPAVRGDAYLFNNLFLSDRPETGTRVFDSFPDRMHFFGSIDEREKQVEAWRTMRRLPVTLSGNLYAGGARMSSREEGTGSAFRMNADAVSVRIEEGADGKTMLITNLYECLDREIRCALLSARSFSPALFPEEDFGDFPEAGDVFREDYMGELLPLTPLPGPFEKPAPRFAVFDASRSGEKDVAEAHTETILKSKTDAITCNLAITGCEDIGLSWNGKRFAAQEIFVRDNTAWIHGVGMSFLYETDVAYGVTKNIDKWTMEAEDTVDARGNETVSQIAGAVLALTAMLRDAAGESDERLSERIRMAALPYLAPYGIELRLTGSYLKFVLLRQKRFITLQEVLFKVANGITDVDAEIVS